MSDIHSVCLDASETAFFARELESLKAKTYDVQFAPMKATSLLPVSTDAGEGAEAITYQSFEETGMARIISSYADDLPRADVRGQEFISKVKSIGCSYGYSHQEIRAAMFANRPLTTMQASAARRANDQKLNRLAWFGDDDYGLLGLLNNPNIPSASVPNDGTGPSTLWSTKTPDQILRDLNQFTNGIVELTKGVETPNTVLLPIEQYTFISSTPRSSTSDTTILEYFLQNNPFIDMVDWVPELTGAGTANADVFVVYDRNPDKLELQLPMPFTQYPPQERNLNFEIPCESRFGGLLVYYPLSVTIAEGI